MIDAILGILGVILGFILSELAQIRRERNNEKKQAQSVRVLICLEIDMNLRSLGDFWSQVTNIEGEHSEDVNLRKWRLAKRFIDIPFPELQSRSFEMQIPQLSISLSELEITLVFQFYERLNRLVTLRENLNTFSIDQQNEWNIASGGSGSIPLEKSFGMAHKFDRNAPLLWDECESLIAQLVAKGNPLKKSKRQASTGLVGKDRA